MPLNDLISKAKNSKLYSTISKVVSTIDRDKERDGFQFISPQTRQNISQATQRVQQSGVLNPFNQLKGFSQALAPSNYGQTTKELFTPLLGEQKAGQLGYGLQGATQLTPSYGLNMLSSDYRQSVQQPQTQQEKDAQQIGRATYGLALTAPLGGANMARNVLARAFTGIGAGAGIGGAITAVTGGDIKQGVKQGAMSGYSFAPIGAITNPITSKILAGAPTLLQNQIGQRAIGGVANVIEDEIQALVDGYDTDTQSRVTSLLIGAALTGNKDAWAITKRKLNSLNVKNADELIKFSKTRLTEAYKDQGAVRLSWSEPDGSRRAVTVDKATQPGWIMYLNNRGVDYRLNFVGGSLGSVGGAPKPPTDPLEALRVEDWVLPKDVSTYQESKAIGAKRIAPDRVPHQQLTPESGIKALVDKQKQRLQSNENGWIAATKKIDDLIKKYGEKLPQRTEKNIKTYPGLIDDHRTYQEYKKYAWQPKNLTDIKTQFERRVSGMKSQWTPEAEAKAFESAKKDYVELIKSDISKGYKYPDSVLDFDRSFRIAEDNRARYEKGLRTSFSSDDQRIVIEDIDKIGGGMKRQDGKPITDSQKDTIKRGVVDFANTMGIDIARLAKDDRWVYAHLNGKNPFLTAMAGGLYRRGANNVSISVSGSETFRKVVDGKEVFDRVHTTMAHELGHALDGKVDKRLFDSQTIWSLRNNFNPIEQMPRGDKYWKSQSEITARMIEQYNAVKKGNTNLFNREGYWKKDVYERIIEPAVEKAINTHFAEYKLQTPLELPQSQPKIPVKPIDRTQLTGKALSTPNEVLIKGRSQPELPAGKTQSDMQLGTKPQTQSVSPDLSVQSKPLLEQQTSQKVRIRSKQSQPLDNIIADGRKSIGQSGKEQNKSVRQVLSDLYTQWVDRYNPIVKASQKAKNTLKIKGAELRPEYDPEYLLRRLTGAGGIADQRFNTELKPIINSIDKAGIPKIDIDTYLAHKRMAGFGDVGREIYGADPMKSKQIISALETKYPQIKELAEQLYAYQDKGLRELAQSGFLSDDAIKAIKSQNPNYAPLYRVMDEMEEYLGLPTRKTMQGSNPVVKIKGSTKQIDSPLENIIGNTFKQRSAIEKNRVAQSLIGLQNVTDMGFKKVAKSGSDTITVWNNGKKEYWQVGSDIAETAKGLNEENMNALLKVLQAPASLLRQGATGRNLEFMIPNIVRDQLDAGITSKYGYIPFVDYVSGLKSMLNNDEYYQKWANSGAKIDLGELSGRKSIQQMFDEKKSRKGLFSWLGSALDVMGKYSEQPTRIGLFKKAYKKTGNELLSVMESRDATVDFARMGSKMKVANSIIPFLNVGVQGFDKLIRSVKNNPGKVALNMGIYGAMPAIATTLYNLTNFKEEYQEIPQYEKDSNFVLIKGRNKDGIVDYVTIPKGNVLPVVANPVQSFLEYLSGANQQSFSELATQLISSTLPVVGDGQSLKEVATKTIGSNLPQAIKPISENLLNKSFYKYSTDKEETKEIVPYYLNKKLPYERAYEWTPVMYKKIGALLNVSPLQVQNLMEGYLAGYTKLPANVIDIMNQVSRGEGVSPNQKPLLRRFIKQTYPSSAKKETYQQPTPSLMDRLTGKVSASDGKVETSPDIIKQKMESRPDLVTPDEIVTYYESKITKPKTGNKYEKAIYEKEIWSKASDINSRESLTQEQKDGAITKLLSNIGVSKEDYDYYEVAKQEVDLKTLRVYDVYDQTKDYDEFMKYLVNGRKPVNGKILISDGVIDNLVDDGLIPYALGKDLKSIDLNEDGSVKTGKIRAKSSKAKTDSIKAYSNALERLGDSLLKVNIKAPTVTSTSTNKINTKGLTFSSAGL